MDSQLKKGVLEYCILAFLNQQDSYGYQIVKNISDIIPITESTLYPILKRLETNEKVSTYSVEHQGRLRKYYKITLEGKKSANTFLQEDWIQLTEIYTFIKEGMNHE